VDIAPKKIADQIVEDSKAAQRGLNGIYNLHKGEPVEQVRPLVQKVFVEHGMNPPDKTVDALADGIANGQKPKLVLGSN
jgi:hypothetical protein